MHKQKQHIINSSLFGILTLMFGIGAITVSSVFVIYYIGFLTTILLLKLLNKNTQELSDTITIFTATLLFGFILAFMVNLDFIENGVTFLYPDQMHFFEEVKHLASSSSISDLTRRAFETDYMEYRVVYFIFGTLAYIDNAITGSVDFLPLLYSVVYITALIPIFLYHIINKYTTNKNAFSAALFYALFTPIMAYSGFLLRDMHITLIVMIVLYLITSKLSIWNLLFIAILIPVTYQIRASNSLLILAMMGIYIFAGKSTKGIKVLFVFVAALFLIYYSSNILAIVSSTENRLEHYEEFTMNSLNDSGIGSRLYSLPPILKEISIILFTLSAFPFFSIFSSSTDLPQFVMALYNSITNVGWFFIFFGLIYFIKPYIRKILTMPNKTFLFLFVLFIFYMIMNVNNMTFRRLICVFPFVYVPFLLVYFEANNRLKTGFMTTATFVGIGLYIAYFILLII